MAEFEELRLTVNLVDNASAGLQRIRQEIGQLTQSAQGMTAGFASASAGLGTFSNQSRQAATSAATLSGGLKQLERGAFDAGRGLTTMATSVTMGGQALPMLATGLKEAVTGLMAMNTQMVGLAPNVRMGAMALGGLAIGVTALGAAAVIAGVYLFRFSKEAEQLGKTARSLGLSFADLKSAGEEAKRFGGSVDEVVRAATGMAKAQADLQRNGSALRAEMVGKGMDPAWLQQYAREEQFHVKSNMLREKGLAIVDAEIARGKTRTAALQTAAEAMQKLGGDPSTMQRRPMPPPDRRWDEIEKKSQNVMNIWREIYDKINGISFGPMGVALDVLTGALKIVNGFLNGAIWAVDKLNAGLGLVGANLLTIAKVLFPQIRILQALGRLGKDEGGSENPIRDAPHEKLGPSTVPLPPASGQRSSLGANDNSLYQPASFGGDGGGGGELQSVIKSGVFDALVEFAAYTQGGGRGGGGGGGFQNAAFTTGGGVPAALGGPGGGAGTGGFRSGGGYSVIPEGGGNAAGGAGLPGGGYQPGGGGASSSGSAAGAAPTPGGRGSGTGGRLNDEGRARVKSWHDFLTKPVDQGGLGRTPEQAQGEIASMMGESGTNLNPKAWNPNDRGQPSGGTAQWRGDRLRALMKRPDWQTPEVQQQFYRDEMLGSEKKANAAITGARTADQATAAHVSAFERPQFPGPESRKRAGNIPAIQGALSGTAGAEPPGGGSAGDAKTPLGSGRVNELQQGAIRNQALDPKLRNALDYAAGSTGLTVDVWSGGQPSHGARRTGSHRHDYGRAGDFKLRDSEGKLVDPTDPRALAFYEKAASAGVTGGGHSYGGMGRSTHLDIAGGVYAGGPQFKGAMERGKQRYASGGLPDDYRAVLDRKALTQTANVNATGSLKVDVNAPPGTNVEASGGGLFANTQLQRSTQMPHTASGPSASETANQYMASR